MTVSRAKAPRLLLRIRRGFRRLGTGARVEQQAVPPDRAWHEMLARLDAEETERRLDAVEAALNGDRRH